MSEKQETTTGHGAKMREALIAVKKSIDGIGASSLDGDPEILMMSLTQVCARLSARIESALAEPPRNCDRFGTDNAEASLAYEEFCDRAEVEESVNGAISWLLSLDAD